MTSSRVSEEVVILYGGSVKPDNVAALVTQPDVDGALVGGASLKAKSFVQILRQSIPRS
jgi:triosephosphate isomerase